MSLSGGKGVSVYVYTRQTHSTLVPELSTVTVMGATSAVEVRASLNLMTASIDLTLWAREDIPSQCIITTLSQQHDPRQLRVEAMCAIASITSRLPLGHPLYYRCGVAAFAVTPWAEERDCNKSLRCHGGNLTMGDSGSQSSSGSDSSRTVLISTQPIRAGEQIKCRNTR